MVLAELNINGASQNEISKFAPNKVLHTRLGDASHSEVAAVFENHAYPLPRGIYPRSGGTLYKPNEEIANRDGYVMKTSPNYEGRSVFTPEQKPYVMTALTYLNALALGEPYGEIDRSGVPFSQRVEQVFTSRDNPKFGEVVADSIFGLIQEYKIRYPNLTPALQASYTGGGIGGTRMVVEGTKRSLSKAKTTNTDDLGVLSPFTDKSFVHLADPKVNEEGIYISDYEVKCKGMVFAVTLVDQVNIAAINLAHSPVSKSYDVSREEFLPENFYDNLINVVFYDQSEQT